MAGCRIKLVSQEKFIRLNHKYQLYNRQVYSGYPWLPENMVRRQDRAMTYGAYDCNIFGLHGGQTGTLGHLSAEDSVKADNKEKIRNILPEDVFQLSKKGSPRGFITGGMVQEQDSRKLHDLLKSEMRNSGVLHISQIWGRINNEVSGPTDVIYNAQKNTWYVHAQMQNRDILTLADLKRAFQKVELASGDTLVTSEGTCTAADVAQGFLRKLGKRIFSAVE